MKPGFQIGATALLGLTIVASGWVTDVTAQDAAPAVVAAPAATPAPPAEQPAEDTGLGLTQGQFLLQIIHVVGAERFFEGPVTAIAAAEKLALIGLAPEGGWHVEQYLTREQLGTAYERLVAARAPAPEPAAAGTAGEAAPAAEPAAATPAVDVSTMTVAQLIDSITEAVRKAFEKIDTERVPVSPSGWHWK